MTPAARRCLGCGTDVPGTGAAGGPTGVGPVRADVDGPTPMFCASCRTHRPTMVTARAAVERAIAARLTLGAGRAGDGRCGTCATTLDLPMRATTRSLTVEPDASAPFTVTVELPLVRCGDCALDNVPPELVDAVRRAVLGACGLADPGNRDTGWFSRLRRRGAPGSLGRPSRP